MENKTSKYITQIDRVLKSERLLKRHRETLEAFDRYIELETNCGLGTRKGYLDTLHDLGVNVRKPFEEMTKEDLQSYLYAESIPHKNSKGARALKWKANPPNPPLLFLCMIAFYPRSHART